MGREVRMVAPGWQHPTFYNEYRRCDDLKGLYEGPFSVKLAEWLEEEAKWNEGLRREWGTDSWKPIKEEYKHHTFEQWTGRKPRQEDYMPEWAPGEATQLMMYETTTEGTPISPAFDTPEELARWLADNGASAFGSSTASYEEWLSTCQSGHAFSAMFINGELISGVAANKVLDED
jgi:hypothetical protein